MISSKQTSWSKRLFICFIQGLFFLTLGELIASQECSCTPLVYKWRLNFTEFCNGYLNIDQGPGTGIDSAFCKIDAPIGSNATDLTPITVTSTQIIELDRDLLALKIQSFKDLNLADGSRIEFTSYTAANADDYTGGIQAELIGFNAQLQSVRLRWSVRYSNLCEVHPYSVGDSLGWMVYVSDSIPRPETCQTRSEQPSQRPSISMAPTTSPTNQPSNPPTRRPSPSPTISVTPSPSLRPSRSPTSHPTAETALPSNLPTAETALPTQMSMSMDYSYSYDYLQTWDGNYVDRFVEFGEREVEVKSNDD